MPYFLLFIAAVLASFGQVFLKKSTFSTSGNETNSIKYLYTLLLNYNIWLALVLYGISFAVYMIALKKVELSTARSFSTLSYIFVMILSFIILKDTATPIKIIGIALISAGIFLVGISNK